MPKTRSQSSVSGLEYQEEGDDSSGDEANNTITATDSVNVPATSNTGVTHANTEVFETIMSTMSSLKSAIDDLRQDSYRNNNEIMSLRSQMDREASTTLPSSIHSQLPQSSIHSQLPQSSVHTHYTPLPPSSIYTPLPPSSIYSQLPPSSIHSQLPQSSVHTQVSPSSVQAHSSPSSTYAQFPSLTSLAQVQTTATNYIHMPPLLHRSQLVSSCCAQMPPPSNYAQMPPLSNFVQQPINYAQSPPTAINSQHLLPPSAMYAATPHTTYNDFSTKLYNLPIFDGKPEDWPLFLATYEDTTAEFGYTYRQNLIRLQKSLQGAAKDSVKSMLIYPENVSQIIEELKFNFGRSELLIKSQLEKVRAYPTVTEERLDIIIGLATCVKNVVAFFKSAKCTNHLSNPTLLDQLVLKLPLSKRYEWAKFSSAIVPVATVEHFSEWISDMARFCSLMPQPKDDRRQQMSTIKPRRVLHSKEDQSIRKECYQCKGSHMLAECEQFNKLTTNAKWEQVKRLRICFSCLSKGHNLTQCQKRKVCAINKCSRYHHRILHQDPHDKAETENNYQTEKVLQCHHDSCSSQLFKILPVTLHGPSGATKIYALLDEGSSVSLLEENVARLMGLKGQKSQITLQWYDNMKKTETSMKVCVEISPANIPEKKYAINNLHTVKKLNLPVQSFDKNKFEHLKYLPVENYINEKPVMLIGLDNCILGLAKEVVEAGPYLPIASATKLGWVAYGPVSKNKNCIARVCHINESSDWKEIHNLVQDYFSIENFGVKANNTVLESDENKRARIILENTTKRVNGRFETGLLWKEDHTVLPDSFEMAKNRLIKVENRMKRDIVYAENYKREINKYISKGYAKLLSPADAHIFSRDKAWYLPHFGVVNPHKPHKLRIVFDAAAMTSNVSLNSALVKGPEHAKPLQAILFQFRQGKIAVAGDIEEMFSQVAIILPDQNSQRFLWRNGESDHELQVYVMQTMIFGAACSPCCAEYVKNINAKEFESTMPRGKNVVVNNTYVDDLVVSFDSIEEALEVTKEAIHINAAAGFNLRNFSSNVFEIECSLNGVNSSESTNYKMETQKDKILGLYWNKITDCFEFEIKFHKISSGVLEGKRPPTKREVLGIVMAIFDPFGFLANFSIVSKLIVRETWKSSLQWDDYLPQKILTQWQAWWREFNNVKQFAIPRCYTTLLAKADEVQLHIFVDASSCAYAAVAYLRVKYKYNIDVSFVMAKSRCAPPRGMTIPRLELQAAVLGCRLKTLIEESHDFSINRIVFWSDSKTVILWIQSTEREYKQFVAYRIAEILTTTNSKQWRWLPTELNVADEATRARLPVSFDNRSRWQMGPDFLKLDEQFWPSDQPITENISRYEEEKIKSVLILRNVEYSIFKFERFSKYLKLKRCAAWVLRFINAKLRNNKPVSTELTAAEIEAGEKLVCRQAQMEVFNIERSHLIKGMVLPKSYSIYQLTPYIDDDMLLRVNGRINNAYCLPDSARNPIIMPSKHAVTLMIMNHYHQKLHHQNDHIVINEVKQKFWVPYIRSVLKTVKKLCPVCIRDNAKPVPPLMGQLPIDRVTPYVRPFSYVGLDYCGPFHVAIGRRREKRWIALFTCLSTRALHLEVAENLSTDSFLMCLRNFVNRRGVPIRIRSDNGTNFIGAQKELVKESRYFDYEEIQRKMSKENIEWVFNCPSNPHAGGCWERLVRCVKQLLSKIFKEEAPRLETFRSALIEAENIINNRPLTQLPVDPETEQPLTPNHFLMGSLNSTQTPSTGDENVCLRKQWRIAQNLKDRLWKRWVLEYLPQLLTRPKWREKVEPLNVGDIVLLLDSNQPRSQWRIGKIRAVYHVPTILLQLYLSRILAFKSS